MSNRLKTLKEKAEKMKQKLLKRQDKEIKSIEQAIEKRIKEEGLEAVVKDFVRDLAFHLHEDNIFRKRLNQDWEKLNKNFEGIDKNFKGTEENFMLVNNLMARAAVTTHLLMTSYLDHLKASGDTLSETDSNLIELHKDITNQINKVRKQTGTNNENNG